MSYILDALRRADAERERDPGRGIHAQPVPLPAESARRFPWWIAALAVALVLVVAGALLLRPAPRVALDLGMPPPNAPVARQPATTRPVAPVAAEVSPPPPQPVPVPVPERVPVRPAVVRAPPVTAPAVPARHAPSAPVVAPPVSAAERIFAISELPPEVQRELPKLPVSGGVHSDNPAQRMLIVGGQVVTEGAEAAPGVLVEQIRPKSAVLKFRGYRFSVQY
jgi:general secretion pathway protein B